MFVYEKKLQYPVKIKTPNPALAKFIVSQYGGPDGELGASMRYLSQRYSMPYPELKALLTDIGTEELGHLEMVAGNDAGRDQTRRLRHLFRRPHRRGLPHGSLRLPLDGGIHAGQRRCDRRSE